MPRPPRLEFPGALYHVTSRGNARKAIFFDDADRERFLLQLAYCLEAEAVVLYAYVLMDNHYHLLVQTQRANLAAFCQRLNTSYALYARYRHRAPGHILQGRYKAKAIESEDYLRRVATYVHLNPARTREVRALAAGEQAERLLAYRWSSLPGCLAAAREEPFVTYEVLDDFAADRVAARLAYRRFVLAALRGDGAEMGKAMRASEYAIGTPSFVAAVEGRIRDLARTEALRRDLAVPSAPPQGLDLSQVQRMVTERFGLPAGALAEHGRTRGAGAAKQMALELAGRHCGLALRDVGQAFGGLTPSAVTMALRRGRERRSEDATLRTLFDDLDRTIAAGAATGRMEK